MSDKRHLLHNKPCLFSNTPVVFFNTPALLVYCDRAFDIIEQCKAENNAITKYWEQYGIKTDTAGDSQALIQLQRVYCDKRKCLRCRFGYEFLKGRTKIEGYRNIAIESDLFAELY